jgi:pimeloyl-ACP methyl ester carboxylesterase
MLTVVQGLVIPDRIASMTLISTTSDWMAELSVVAGAKTFWSFFRPKSEDQKLADVKTHMFGESWINEPDEQGVFPTNGDNWAATVYVDSVVYYRGILLQAPACAGHKVKPEQLQKMAKTIGYSNILIIHGHKDKVFPFPAVQRLFDAFGGHQDSGVKLKVLEDTGHLPPVERFQETVQLIEELTNNAKAPPT